MEEKQYTGRRMRRNHSNALPRYIVSYATEIENVPDEINPTISRDVFKRGSIISCRMVNLEPQAIKPRILYSEKEFWDSVCDLSAVNYTTWVIGHSMLYQMLVSNMADEFEQARFVIDWPRAKRKRENNDDSDSHSSALVILNNPPTIIATRCVASGGRVVFVDLLNWFSTSLQSIADTVENDRIDWRTAIKGFEEFDTPSMRDAGVVLATFLRLMTWSRKHDMGMFRYTAASQAMSAYRHRFMTHEIFVHDNMDIKRLERDAYFGGRTELFKVGEFRQTVHQLDVSSLFPSVMKSGIYPVKLERFMRTVHWSANLPDIQWQNSVARVWLQTKKPIYPVRLPQGIVYPIGQFETTLCGEELAAAHSYGDILSVQSWAEYKTERIFDSWVDYLWELRSVHEQEGDIIYAKLVKLMLNGLYGKFAQKSSAWVNVADVEPDEPWREWTKVNCVTQTRRQFRAFGWHVQEYVGEGEMLNTFVAISAFVSAAARMRMNQLRDIAKREHVYYQGVDSLLVTAEGYNNLCVAGEVEERTLGKLRPEVVADSGEILGYCDYRIGSKIVKSGLAGNAVEIDDSGLLQQIRHVSKSLFDPNRRGGVVLEKTQWNREGSTAKGVVDQDGTVWPFVFGDEGGSPLPS